MRSKPDNYYDLAIADPPLGKKQDGRQNRSHWMNDHQGRSYFIQDGNYTTKNWDEALPSTEYFNELFRISRHQIIWGVPCLPFNPGQGRIVWNKLNGTSDQYDGEIAYCSLNDRTELISYLWNGMMQGQSICNPLMQQGNKALNEKRLHPTHKPVALHAMIFERYQVPKHWKIFDPNLGSGSLGIACLVLGYQLDGCENDREYFELASRWLKEEHQSLKPSTVTKLICKK